MLLPMWRVLGDVFKVGEYHCMLPDGGALDAS